jgi:DNA-binding protein HU-beta
VIVNKSQLVKVVSASTTATRQIVEDVVDVLFDTIVTEVRSGRKVTVVGFGAFNPTTRGARVGRNPRTGAVVPIPASKGVRFATGSTFKSALNPKEGVSMAVKKAAAKRAVRKAPAKKTAARKATAKKAVKKAPARKKATAKKTTAKKATAKRTVKRAPARKTAAKKATAKRTVKKAPARKKAAAKRTPAKRTVKKAPARKKATAKKAPARKKATAKRGLRAPPGAPDRGQTSSIRWKASAAARPADAPWAASCRATLASNRARSAAGAVA